MKPNSTLLIFFSFCIALASVAEAQRSDPKVQPQKFNVSDKSFESNGNFIVAMSLLQKLEPAVLWETAEQCTVADVTRSPYSSLGKLIKLTGKVSEIEELPPSFTSQPGWYNILTVASNPNSARGGTLIELIYHGDALQIPPKSTISFAGYFVGTFSSRNASKVTVEQLVLVGNSIQIQGARTK